MISTIRLNGQWHFYADEEKKYTGFVPQDSVFTDTVRLPGTTAQNGKGTPNEKREDGFLTELYPYKGNAWYCREVQIPEELHGKKMRLFLERTRVTTLWVNGQYIGTQNSLCTPHVYDLSTFSHAQTLRLCICVDNTDYPAAGGHMTSPDTQTNWNGITGELSLRFYDENCIISVKAEPDTQKRQVTLRMRTQGTVNILCAEGTWVGKEGAEIPSQVLSVTRNADGEAVAVMPLGSNAPLWDEYNPVFARLMLRPFGSQDVTEVQFGLTDFRTQGHQFTNHGRSVFLRGKHDGMIFPLEGAAPTDVNAWVCVMSIAKSYGINHYRFHTCCPPEAAFTAADMLGIYMEPEIPFWGSLTAPDDANYNAAEQNYLIAEGRKILETFGNHPSFCMFSLGNELWGSAERMGEVIAYYKKNEKRILFTQGCNNFQFWPNIQPEDDFFVGVRLSADRLIRGSYGACDQPFGHVQAQRPSTMHSYDAFIHPERLADTSSENGTDEIEIQYGTGVKKIRMDKTVSGLIPDKPVITHEIGQYCTYPNFEEIPKYTGVLRAYNFEIFRERLEAAGMADRAKDFFKCSGKLSVQCYKEELEAAMRSQYVAGYQILDIQDFTGQGTALVGILDAFMESKGITDAEEWRMFCSDSVLLGQFPDYCLTDKLHVRVSLRHYHPKSVNAPLQYTVTRGRKLLTEGELPVHITRQGLFALGDITANLPPASAVHKITVTLSLPHTKNVYSLWQFPEQEMPSLESTERVCVTADFAEARKRLEAGGSVLYMAGELTNKVKGFYCSDFWCYPMFRSISESMGKEVPIGTLGLCIDKHHPAIQKFRPERWSTPQWYDLVSHADLAVLDGLPIQPIVQMIDNFERNHKLGLLFECKVGRGRLLVCTARLSEISDRPEVRQFAQCLLTYVVSPLFSPEVQIPADVLEEILR